MVISVVSVTFFAVFFVLDVAQAKTAVSYYYSMGEQCEKTERVFIYAYVPRDTMKQLTSVFDAVSWWKSGVFNAPSGSHNELAGLTGEDSSEIKEMIEFFHPGEEKSAKATYHDVPSLSSAMRDAGETKNQQIVVLEIDEDISGKKGMLDSLKVIMGNVQSRECSAFLFIEKGSARAKGEKRESSTLFGDGLFAGRSGNGRVLSSSSSSSSGSSSSSLNMTPDTFVGLVLFASFLFIILVGLGCTNDIKGATVFTDEKSIPPVGKEA